MILSMLSGSPIALILDMDGVILDTERVAKRAWMQGAADLHIVFPESVYHGMIGLTGPEGRQYLLKHSWAEEVVDRLEHVAWNHYRAFLEEEGVPAKPGLEALLDFLDRRKIPRAVATSTNTSSAKARLDRVGALSRVDVVVGGDQIRHGKPAPDIYLRAADALGYAPAKCLAIEDSRNGLRSAVAAGMDVVLVPDLCPIDEETRRLASATVQTLADVIPYIEAFMK
jgi:HAD superfamily hydrolase (TIGR01509 family)